MKPIIDQLFAHPYATIFAGCCIWVMVACVIATFFKGCECCNDEECASNAHACDLDETDNGTHSV